MSMPLGVVVDDFRKPVKIGLQQAADLGFHAVEIGAAQGEVAPEALSDSGRRHLARYVGNLGLRLDALTAHLISGNFGENVIREEHLERTGRILELAKDVHAPIVTARIGRLDEDAGSDRYQQILDAVRHLADHADKVGTVFAIETAEADPKDLIAFLKRVDCPMVRAAFDPAELIMDGNNPVATVPVLANHIAIARARDAVTGGARRPGHETSLGSGQLDLIGYLNALEEAGYTGAAVVHRTDARNPAEEIALAKAQLDAALRSALG
jgi:sugar phosphate isomerase/epimerase